MSNRCIHCSSTGVCKFCKGTGKSGGGTGRLSCIHCNGSGVCSFCNGASARGGQRMTSHRPQMGFQQQPQMGFQQQPQMGFQQQPQMGFQQQPQMGMNQNIMNDEPAQMAYINKDGTVDDPEKMLDFYIPILQKGGMQAKMMRFSLKQVRSFGGGFSVLAKPLLNRLMTASDREKIGCLTLIGALESAAAGVIEEASRYLMHPNSVVRIAAIDAFEQLGNYAVIGEKNLQFIEKNDPDKNFRKKAEKMLNKISKINPDEKALIIDEEHQKYETITSATEMEAQSKNIDTSKLAPAAQDFGQAKNIFFMSHALPDFPWVEKAINEISKWPGCYCWTCERDISPGEDWLTEIYKGLDACNWYILFWSDKAEASKWTNEEMREVKTKTVSSGNPKVSIVNLGRQDWPRLLSRHQGAVVTSDDQLTEWLNNLKSQVQL